MVSLLMIADDFTGALDTGVQLAKAGIRTFVSIRTDLTGQWLPPDAEVCVIDNETRHLPPEEAYRLTARIAADAQRMGIRWIYLKTDSAMRGNIGAQMRALLDLYGGSIGFAPAYPRAGRTTEQGVQLVDGVPLQLTDYANDLLNPITTGEIQTILQGQAPLSVRLAAPGDAAAPDTDVTVYDSRDQRELQQAARSIRDSGVHLIAGCAGLGEFLPEILPFRGSDGLPRPSCRSLLVVSGSVNAQSLKQLQQAQAEGFGLSELTYRQKTAEDPLSSGEDQQWLDGLAEQLQERPQVLATILSKESLGRFEARLQAEGIDTRTASERIPQNIAAIAAALIRRTGSLGLVVFGGDTAIAIMRALGVSGLSPICEISPSVPCSVIRVGEREIPLVTKSGGLGSDGIAGEIRRFLQPSEAAE